MTTREARAHLLRQHRQLRAWLVLAQRLAERFQQGEAVGLELEVVMCRLRDDFATHNQDEEAVLEPLLRRAAHDGRGSARIAWMREQHAAEHLDFRVALTLSAREIVPRLGQLARDIEAHMAAEERTVLAADVLRTTTEQP